MRTTWVPGVDPRFTSLAQWTRLSPSTTFEIPRPGVNLYEQLADSLALSIRGGRLQPGHRLPTESAMKERNEATRRDFAQQGP